MGEPVAVIGIGCRFPGAYGPDGLWALLRDGRDAVTEVPPDRFDAAAVYDPRPATPGRIPTRAGGFLDRIDEFDAEFFGISAREAAHMDPQQRLLLETGWEAIEDAGVLPGHRTGVFVGQITSNYWDLLYRAGALDIYANVGTTRSALAGRLSFALDLRGPSMTVDAACSSSLVAVHLAVQSLRRGECDLALAGGANLILHAAETITFAQAEMISPRGRCAFGSDTADGFVRSEGVGIVVLKPLARALADGDSPYAVIHGSATGSDGRSSGLLMTPGADGQAETIRAAYADAGIAPADVGYVEAHGTGNIAGDSAELAGLAQVFDHPLKTGSVKTNIGHTEAAAGVAGLIKAVLCVSNREIPASLHNGSAAAADRTAADGTAADRIAVARERSAWPPGPAIAGVSSFGISGTNAHVVVGEAAAPPSEPPPSEPPPSGGPHLLAISARTPEALRDLAAAYTEQALAPLADVCYTAAARRRHHESRLTVVGSTPDEIAGKLRAHLRGESVPLLGTADDVADRKLKVVYVFSGQGAQWAGMGRDLLTRSAVFREAMAACDTAIRAEAGWSVLETAELEGIERIQPALWAMQVALAAVWRSYGIDPDVVIGHSMGEVAAACVAGLLDLADGAAVICRRSALLATVAGQGAMLSVDLPEADACREIADVTDLVSVAVSNGPRSTVLSGDPAALDEIARQLEERDIGCRPVKVDVASHGPQMDPLLEPLTAALGPLTPRPGAVPLYSTVLGREVAAVDAGYWARNLREPVRFGSAVLAQAPAVFIELSPHPLLMTAITQTADCGYAIPSLRRGEPELDAILDGLGALYRAGFGVPWQRVHGSAHRVVRLPRYPWQRRRYWLAEGAGPATQDRVSEHRVSEHRVDRPYLTDHRVRGEPVLPGTAYLDLVITAEPGARALREVAFHHPLVLTGEPALLRVVRTADRFEITGGGVEYVTGRLSRLPAEPARRDMTTPGERVTGEEFYARSAAAGNQWSGAFRGITELWREDGRSVARIDPPPATPFPAVLDACGQVLAASGPGGPFVLAGIGAVNLYRPLTGPTLWSHATAAVRDGCLTGDVAITDPDGTVLAELTGVRLRYLDGARPRQWLHEIRWAERPPLSPRAAPASWVVFADADGAGSALASRLRGDGHRCAVVAPGEGYAEQGNGRYVIDPACAEDHRRVLAAANAENVVYLFALRARDALDALKGTLLLARALSPAAHLWLVTRGAQPAGGSTVAPDQAAVWGFGRALAQERPGRGTTLVDLDPSGSDGLTAEVTGESDGETEVALRRGNRLVPRLVPLRDTGAPVPSADQTGMTIEIGSGMPGLLDTVGPRLAARLGARRGEVEIETRNAALNYRDVLVAMDAYPGQDGAPAPLGWECAGTVTAVGQGVAGIRVGDEVIALASPALAGHVRADARLVVPRPARLSAPDAATLPAAFLTAYYALCDLARVQPGERVLIHSAAGGVGLAAIQVARWKGAEILATAGTAGKRALLRMLGVRHVFDSRSAGFADEVRAATLGEGVDVVLNTLTGEAIARGIALLAPYGRYIELTKRDLLAGASLDLRPFARNLAYFAVDVADMIQTRPAQAGRILREVVRLVDAGVLTPLPYTEFPVARAAAAFQHLARPEHIGKVVLTFTGSAVTSGTPGLDPDATYLVTGGLGDLGRIVAQWLASSGARHLLLIGRTPRPQDPALAELARLGAQAAYETVDVADETALRVLLDRRAKAGCPPVRGVVHAAGVVDLRLVDELRPDELAGMLRPKVAGGWALHRALQDAPLDFFVLFSSASAVLGSPMLAAYAAANAFLDGLAHHRRAAGRPALAINWGYWSGTGMVARLATEHARQLVPHGMAALTREEGLDALRMLMAGRATQALVLPADWDRWRAAHPEAARAPLLRELFAGTASPGTASPGARPPDATPRAGAAGGLGGRTAEEYLLSHVASVLGVPAERVSTRRPLTDQGIDSLMAIEVRARVRRDLGAALSVRKILGHQTIAELAAFLTGALNGESPS